VVIATFPILGACRGALPAHARPRPRALRVRPPLLPRRAPRPPGRDRRL